MVMAWRADNLAPMRKPTFAFGAHGHLGPVKILIVGITNFGASLYRESVAGPHLKGADYPTLVAL